MITEFKIFEELIDSTTLPLYQIGDYVEIELYKDTNIMLINDIDTIVLRDNVTHTDRKIFQYEGEIERNDDIENEVIYVLEQYVIRKLTPEEVELYKNMEKYNL